MVGLTVLLVFSSGYLIEVFKDNNPFAIRPTAGALEAQEVYGELIQTNIKGLDGTGVRVCIVDSGIDTTHQDLSGMNLVAWRDFVNNQEQPYDDQDTEPVWLEFLLPMVGWKVLLPKWN